MEVLGLEGKAGIRRRPLRKQYVRGDGGVNSCLVILKQPDGSEPTGLLPDGLQSTHSACNPVFSFLTARCVVIVSFFLSFLKLLV